jgi:osmotically-inducible protein OsmY
MTDGTNHTDHPDHTGYTGYNTHDALEQLIQRRLHATLNDDITVGVGEDAVYLSGRVQSDAERQVAEEVTRTMAEGMGVENDLAVERLLPEDRIETRSPDLGEGRLYEHVTGPEENIGSLNPAFTGQPIESNPDADAGLADNPPVEPDPTYFPPTDPVVPPDGDENRIVQGGFAPTSMEGMEIERSAEDNLPGDEALADAIREALANDAATTALQLDVMVEAGVAHLHGKVPDLVDAENAEAVASEVPGVREVVDETTVEHM